jgi:hypothetical protein
MTKTMGSEIESMLVVGSGMTADCSWVVVVEAVVVLARS